MIWNYMRLRTKLLEEENINSKLSLLHFIENIAISLHDSRLVLQAVQSDQLEKYIFRSYGALMLSDLFCEMI